MSQRLVAFLSSTVQDFGPVRAKLREELQARSIEVRISEDPEFPVEPGVTSHDACLRAVRDAHVFILLVGERFGGEYLSQNKSITWREWEEAMDAGLLPIVLVHRDANALAQDIFRERRALVAAHPDEPVVDIDRRLRRDPRFADEKPRRENLPGVQRFIDALRKGHVDNWMHSDWDGSAEQALRRIDARLSSALATKRAMQNSLREIAARETLRTNALHLLMSAATSIAMAVASGQRTLDDAIDHLLLIMAEQRSALFGYRDRDHHNFVLYVRDGDVMRVRHRRAHSAIETHGREWKIGHGHVGLAAQTGKLLVSGDIRNTEAWVPSRARATDPSFYVSSVSVPFAVRPDGPEAVLIATSSRLDHFRSPDQVEVLTLGIVANIFTLITSAGVHSAGVRAR